MTLPERVRLFVAVSLPEEQLVAVDGALQDLRKSLRNVRWAPVANQHVTLKFLGSTPSDRLGDVRRVVEETARAHAPGRFSLGSLGAFPRPSRARVLWVGLDDPQELLTSLAAELARGFEPLGYEPEKRSFTPHLTLARFKVPARLEDQLASVTLPEAEPFVVDTLELFRSHLHPKGARYEVLDRIPLRS